MIPYKFIQNIMVLERWNCGSTKHSIFNNFWQTKNDWIKNPKFTRHHKKKSKKKPKKYAKIVLYVLLEKTVVCSYHQIPCTIQDLRRTKMKTSYRIYRKFLMLKMPQKRILLRFLSSKLTRKKYIYFWYKNGDTFMMIVHPLHLILP